MPSRSRVTRRTVIKGALGAAGSSLLPSAAFAQGKRGGVLMVAADSEATNWNGAIAASNGDPIPKRLSLYVHIPFCARRCDYCAFATFTDRHHLQQQYLDALCADIERADLPVATSVFVGGGTPTAVDAAALGEVLRVHGQAPLHWQSLPSNALAQRIQPHQLGLHFPQLDRHGIEIGAQEGLGLLGLALARRPAGEPAAVPRLLAYFAIASFLASPVQNGLSRLIETRADVGALEATHDPAAFIAMTSLFWLSVISVMIVASSTE